MSTTEQTTPTAARRQVSPSKAEVAEARALSKEVGLEYVDLDRYPLNAAATSLLPEQASRRHHALAIGWKYGTPVVAVARPDNIMTMDDLRTIIGRDIHAVVACESQIDAYIERMYARAEAPATGHARPARAAAEKPPRLQARSCRSRSATPADGAGASPCRVAEASAPAKPPHLLAGPDQSRSRLPRPSTDAPSTAQLRKPADTPRPRPGPARAGSARGTPAWRRARRPRRRPKPWTRSWPTELAEAPARRRQLARTDAGTPKTATPDLAELLVQLRTGHPRGDGSRVPREGGDGEVARRDPERARPRHRGGPDPCIGCRGRHGVRRPQRPTARPRGDKADPRGACSSPPCARARLPG